MFSGSCLKSLVMMSVCLFAGALASAGCGTDQQGGADSSPELQGQAGSSPAAAGQGGGAGAAENSAPATGEAAGADDRDPEMCTQNEVRISRIYPRLLFVIDGSGSMQEPFPGAASRWAAVRAALTDAESGILSSFQSIARFGMVVYSGGAESSLIGPSLPPSPSADDEPCPHMISVEPEANNLEALAASLPEKPPGGWSPTAPALEQAYLLLPEAGLEPGDDAESLHMVLCGDGEPNGCPLPEDSADKIPSVDFDGPVRAVTAGAALGVKTHVVSLACKSAELRQHLDLLASVGRTGSEAIYPATAEELRQKLVEIATGALGCKVRMNGAARTDRPCAGELMLNGKQLECGGEHGWQLADERHLELMGDACEELNGNPASLLHAAFPCDLFTPD